MTRSQTENPFTQKRQKPALSNIYTKKTINQLSKKWVLTEHVFFHLKPTTEFVHYNLIPKNKRYKQNTVKSNNKNATEVNLRTLSPYRK